MLFGLFGSEDSVDFAALPASFSSEIVVLDNYPESNSNPLVREPGVCLTTDKMWKRDSTEYWVLNGIRTGDAFGNDCHEFEFNAQPDGTYSILLRNTPFFEDEFWNAGYLAM